MKELKKQPQYFIRMRGNTAANPTTLEVLLATVSIHYVLYNEHAYAIQNETKCNTSYLS